MRLVDMQCVIEMIAKLLGSDFDVRVDSINDIVGKIPVTIQAELSQFPVESVQSETLDLTITAYLNVDNEVVKSSQLYKFTKIVGTHKGTILDGAGKEFRFSMFINASRPITDPVYDMGFDCAVYQLTGTLLLAASEGGGIFSNGIITELSDKPFSDNARTSGELAVINYEVDPSYNIENTFNADGENAMPRFSGKARVWAISCIMIDCAIDELICKHIEQNSGGINFYLKRTYPNGQSFVKLVKLVGGKLSGQAGAYSYYSIVLQELGG